MSPRLASLFFALGACAWVPHWACHYYRLETNSAFIVGSWEFSRADSIGAMAIYSLLIVMNLAAVEVRSLRFPAGVIAGMLHLAFAALHVWRIAHPFPFVVFGYAWPLGASLREALILAAFGAMSVWVGFVSRTRR